MKFRTEINLPPLSHGISYEDTILALGSCFATSIGEKLQRARFKTEVNPTGALYNPLSVLDAMERFHERKYITPQELLHSPRGWFHHSIQGVAGGDLSAQEATAVLNTMVEKGARALSESSVVIITLGTSWLYRMAQSGEVVTNCHKMPAENFVRSMISADEVYQALKKLIESYLSGKKVILTLSPIRHLADGLESNFLSKATLKIAIERIVQEFDAVNYFPSYEIMMDDLRDYRFYAEDMVHPSKVAVDYIWELFQGALFDAKTEGLLRQVERVVRGYEHRPLNGYTSDYQRFCLNVIEQMNQLQGIEWGEIAEHFNSELSHF